MANDITNDVKGVFCLGLIAVGIEALDAVIPPIEVFFNDLKLTFGTLGYVLLAFCVLTPFILKKVSDNENICRVAIISTFLVWGGFFVYHWGFFSINLAKIPNESWWYAIKAGLIFFVIPVLGGLGLSVVACYIGIAVYSAVIGTAIFIYQTALILYGTGVWFVSLFSKKARAEKSGQKRDRYQDAEKHFKQDNPPRGWENIHPNDMPLLRNALDTANPPHVREEWFKKIMVRERKRSGQTSRDLVKNKA